MGANDPKTTTTTTTIEVRSDVPIDSIRISFHPPACILYIHLFAHLSISRDWSTLVRTRAFFADKVNNNRWRAGGRTGDRAGQRKCQPSPHDESETGRRRPTNVGKDNVVVIDSKVICLPRKACQLSIGCAVCCAQPEVADASRPKKK